MIPGVPSIGGTELIILLGIILLFFGAKRIPDLARSLGKGTREFRKGLSETTEDKAHEEEERKQKGQEKLSLNGAAAVHGMRCLARSRAYKHRPEALEAKASLHPGPFSCPRFPRILDTGSPVSENFPSETGMPYSG